MGGVFINYRGDDSQTAAALIDRELAAEFGKDNVFLDSWTLGRFRWVSISSRSYWGGYRLAA